MKKLLLSSFLLVLIPALSRATDINATSCANTAGSTHVQDAIDKAVTGDRVLVPAGTCTWTIAITITNKGIKLLGPTCDALADITPPTFTTPACTLDLTLGVAPGINIVACSFANLVEVGYMTLRLGSGINSGSGLINPECSGATGYPPIGIYFHDIQFATTTAGDAGRWLMANAIFGVVTKSQFLAGCSNNIGNISAGSDGSFSTSALYHHPIVLGDEKALYIENNFFYSCTHGQGNGATDNYVSAYVFRFNTVYNNNASHHGYDSQVRGVSKFENYENTYIHEPNTGSEDIIYARSGTGTVVNNTIKNITGGSGSYGTMLSMQYYGAMSSADAFITNLGGWYPQRPDAYYPSGNWANNPVDGTTHTNFVEASSYVGYSACSPVDGNLNNAFPPDSMDSDAANTRTVTDMSTTAGNPTFGSVNANFVNADLKKFIIATNFKRGRIRDACTFTASGTTMSCSGESFDDGDVGRHISKTSRGEFSGGVTVARIASITNGTTVELDRTSNDAGTGQVILSEPIILSINEASNQATMNVRATATDSSLSLTIGYSNQCYPLLDQPGRGYFPANNAGNWPNSSSYSTANYQKLMPVYLVNNIKQTVNSDLSVISTDTMPPSAVTYDSTAGYMKPNREWYDPAVSFDGSSGTGRGLFSNRPNNCTTGVAYWATDKGGNWNTLNADANNDGALYICTATNVWSTDGDGTTYVPCVYPHYLATGGSTCAVAGGGGGGGNSRKSGARIRIR